MVDPHYDRAAHIRGRSIWLRTVRSISDVHPIERI
jgi:hypothetical protein